METGSDCCELLLSAYTSSRRRRRLPPHAGPSGTGKERLEAQTCPAAYRSLFDSCYSSLYCTAMLSTLEPVVTVLLATWIFDERLNPIVMFGGTLILVAVILLTRGELEKKPSPRTSLVE